MGYFPQLCTGESLGSPTGCMSYTGREAALRAEELGERGGQWGCVGKLSLFATYTMRACIRNSSPHRGGPEEESKRSTQGAFRGMHVFFLGGKDALSCQY